MARGVMLGYAQVAAAAILWGGWALFLRPAGLAGPASAFVALMVMALPGPFVFRKEALRDRRATLALAIFGLTDAANAALYFAALERGPVAIAVLTHYLAPLLVAFGAPRVLGEVRSRRALVGAPWMLGGLAVCLLSSGAAFSLSTALLGAGSALFYAANVLAAKWAVRAYAPLAVVALHAPISALVLLLATGGAAVPPADPRALALVALGGMICGLGGNLLFNAGLWRISAQAAGVLTYLEPLAAVAVGHAAFGEGLSPASIAGAMLVITAGAWVAAERR